MKAGDKVAVITRVGKTEQKLLRIDTIVRETGTLLITNTGDRFYKKTLGAVSGSRHHIVAATQAHVEALATREASDHQKKLDREAAESRKRELRDKFPKGLFPNVSDFGDKLELSFEVTWSQAEAIATALRDAFE